MTFLGVKPQTPNSPRKRRNSVARVKRLRRSRAAATPAQRERLRLLRQQHGLGEYKSK